MIHTDCNRSLTLGRPVRSVIQPDGKQTGTWSKEELNTDRKEWLKYVLEYRKQQERHANEMQSLYG